jgi:hypothetical protein
MKHRLFYFPAAGFSVMKDYRWEGTFRLTLGTGPEFPFAVVNSNCGIRKLLCDRRN